MTIVPLPSPTLIELRPYRSDDAERTLGVFRAAVHEGAADHYTEAQRDAWAPAATDLRAWDNARASRMTWVAELRGQAVGFSDLKPDGEVDMLFVHPSATRRGVATALLEEVEQTAREAGIPRLHARVSLTAQPLFRRRGFVLLREQLVDVRGERLANAVMEKVMEPGS